MKHLLPGLAPGLTCRSPECDSAPGPVGSHSCLCPCSCQLCLIPTLLDQNLRPAREELVSFSSAVKGGGGGYS